MVWRALDVVKCVVSLVTLRVQKQKKKLSRTLCTIMRTPPRMMEERMGAQEPVDGLRRPLPSCSTIRFSVLLTTVPSWWNNPNAMGEGYPSMTVTIVTWYFRWIERLGVSECGMRAHLLWIRVLSPHQLCKI